MKPVIDFHAHILPGMDHGCPDPEHTRKQLHAAAAAGVTHIVASSHFYSAKDDLEKFLARRARAVEQLNEVNDTDIIVLPAAEVQISSRLPEMDGYERLCITGTDTMLLEMPWDSWTNQTFDAIMRTDSDCCHPVIAHIDRYPEKDQARVLELGLPLQVNAPALCAMMSRRRLKEMLRQEQICCLGSDVHLEYQHDYDCFAKALRALKDDAVRIMAWSADRLGI